MNKAGEAELLKGAKAFDMQALGQIYDIYSPGLYGYALRLLGDNCMAEDCVSETFARLLKNLRVGHGPNDHLQAYLYRVAHNWITDQYRRQPPPPVNLEDDLREEEETQPEPLTSRKMEQDRVRSALRSLTPDQRQVVILRFIEGWENEQVAAAVQKPVGAVKALQHRALATLRRCLLRGEKENHYGYEHEV